MDTIILETRSELLGKLNDVRQNIDNMITAKLSEVSHWKFASNEYYAPLPYMHEIFKLKRGNILKNITENERLSKSTIYSFGFNQFEQLLIMQFPNVDNDIKCGTGTHIYTINQNKSIDTCVTQWYPDGNVPTELIAIHVFKPLNDKNWLYVAVNRNKQDWHSLHYLYNDVNRLERVVAYQSRVATSWSYDFIYDGEERLEKIMIGDNVWWKRKRKLTLNK